MSIFDHVQSRFDAQKEEEPSVAQTPTNPDDENRQSSKQRNQKRKVPEPRRSPG